MSETSASVIKEDLGKGISHWHIQLFALAGAIGVGLFWSTSFSIARAGPAILLCYAVGAVLVFMVTRALGEMAVEMPMAGSFSAYAYMYLGPKGGYITGWIYWLMWIVTGMAEITACGKFGAMLFGLGKESEWIFAFAGLLLVLFVNLRAVGVFGRIEFTLASLKLIVVGMLFLIGIAILGFGFGVGSYERITSPAISNIWALEGGFMPNGWSGIALAMGIVVFSLLGCETIGVTAGETADPMKTIPSAVKKAPFRVIICYIGSLFVILSLLQWTSIGKDSSFIVIFGDAAAMLGIPSAVPVKVMICVVLLAAFSVLNEAVYSSGRMGYTLALQGRGPKYLGVTNQTTKIPARGVWFSCIVMGIAVVLSILFATDTVFEIIVNVAGFAALWTWATIMIIHYKFKKEKQVKGEKSRFPMPLFPMLNILTLIIVVVCYFGMAVSGDPESSVPILVGLGCVAALALIYVCIGWHKDDKNFDVAKAISNTEEK